VASKRGTAQVAFAVIATTAVLVAVFLPVGFLEGNTGRLFRELAVALAAAVALSAFVALTLTPMMASKLLKPHHAQAPGQRPSTATWSAQRGPMARAGPPRRPHLDLPAGDGGRAGGQLGLLKLLPSSWPRPKTAVRSRS
jgi:multidrug efflux pump subunit AcrB